MAENMYSFELNVIDSSAEEIVKTARNEITASIKQANSIPKSLYTEESYQALSDALTIAKALRDSTDKNLLIAANNLLSNAINSLVKKDEVGETTTPAETDTQQATDATTQEAKGCGSSLTASALIVGTVMTFGMFLSIKKKDE